MENNTKNNEESSLKEAMNSVLIHYKELIEAIKLVAEKLPEDAINRKILDMSLEKAHKIVEILEEDM